MQITSAIILLVLATAASVANAEGGAAAGEAKVKIGIKKRVENCTIKTRKGDMVHMHYTVSCGVHSNITRLFTFFYISSPQGTLEDGTEFDSSIPRGQPLSFTVGAGQVIKGWDQGLLGMCVGEKRRLVIPPELGYGSTGAGAKIPPGATLIFETELVKIDRGDKDL